MSALLFSSGRLAWLRQAWQQGHLTPVVCRQTAEELLRVLAYPKFKLSASEHEALLVDFLPYTESVPLPSPWPELPKCRDPNDQVFLALAHTSHADALISGDQDLLSMQGQFAFPILSEQVPAGLLR